MQDPEMAQAHKELASFQTSDCRAMTILQAVQSSLIAILRPLIISLSRLDTVF
jgi:hypothetical protein